MDNINKKKLLLIVEDEKVLSNTLEERLVSEGFEVIKAFDGGEGLQLALSKHPDLILLDLLMPKVDGLTMFKKLREDPWGEYAPVIILTNADSSSNVADAMTIGHSDTFEYILKTSLSLDGVVSRIKKRLGLIN